MLQNIIREDQLLAISSETDNAWTSEEPAACFVFVNKEELARHDRMFRLSVAYDFSHHDTLYASECSTFKISGVKIEMDRYDAAAPHANVYMHLKTAANIIEALNKSSPYPCELRDSKFLSYRPEEVHVRCSLMKSHSIHMLITEDDIINADICPTQLRHLERKRDINTIATSYHALASEKSTADYRCDLIVEGAHQWKKNSQGIREEVLQVFFNIKEIRLTTQLSVKRPRA